MIKINYFFYIKKDNHSVLTCLDSSARIHVKTETFTFPKCVVCT